MDDVYSNLWEDFRAWCRVRRHAAAGPRFSLASVGRETGATYPDLSSAYKAASVQLLLHWVAEKSREIDPCPLRRLHSESLAMWVRTCAAAGVWMSGEERQRAFQHGRTYLLSHMRLAKLHLAENPAQAPAALFFIRPKHHSFDHLVGPCGAQTKRESGRATEQRGDTETDREGERRSKGETRRRTAKARGGRAQRMRPSSSRPAAVRLPTDNLCAGARPRALGGQPVALPARGPRIGFGTGPPRAETAGRAVERKHAHPMAEWCAWHRRHAPACSPCVPRPGMGMLACACKPCMPCLSGR
jgi:hypothetical protein